MLYEFRLPDIGEGVVEGEIVQWHHAEGEVVHEDDPLVEVMTDKATVTIPSPVTGRIVKRHYDQGAMAQVGTLLVTIDTSATAASAEPAPAEPPASTSAAPAASSASPPSPPPAPAPTARPASPPLAAAPPPPAPAPRAPAAPPAPPPPPPKDGPAVVPPPPRAPRPRRVLAAPAVRRLAREHGVDIHSLEGSGPGGRVLREDVLRAVEAQRAAAPSAPPAAAPEAPAPAAPPAAAASAPRAISVKIVEEPGDERVPIRALRRRIYERMALSMHTAAHFTYVEEIDVTALVALRDRLRARAEQQGVKLTFLPFLLKACAVAFRDHPKMNAVVDDARGDYVLKRRANIGVAVATEAGLTVPVVHDVQDRTIFELAQLVSDKSERARQGKLRPEDFEDGTFTITSLGRIGGLLATPIVNYPEVAIVGVHKIEDRAVVVDGEIVVRKRMNLSSSFDHRIVDGHEGAAFVQRVRALLEDPDTLLLEMR